MRRTCAAGELRSAATDLDVSTDALESDPRTAAGGLDRADLDHDGRVQGERETAVLFDMLDRMDGRRDGRLLLVRSDGTAAPAAPALSAIADLGHAPALSTAAQTDPRDAIAMIGMRDAAVTEARALRGQAAVHFIGDRRDRADVAAGVDLSSAKGCGAFAAALDLPAETCKRIARLLETVAPGARRELAELARIWAPAERGRPIPSRLMVSGHGDGESFFGDDGDSLRCADLVALARAMPSAARAIESIHLAACQFGHEARIQAVVGAFPEVRSIWGYAGFSPAEAPARAHQSIWERRTRARGDDDGALAREETRGTRRGETVAIWTRARGFEGPRTRQLSVLVEELASTRWLYERLWRGEADIVDPMRGPIADRYRLVQQVIGHLDFAGQTQTFRRFWSDERDAILRLRFFGAVTHAFERTYGARIAAGYRAIGLEPPSISGMTRRAALSEVARFEHAMRTRSPVPYSARAAWVLLSRGLRDLRATEIPVAWL